jgi:membrane protease YdiL (CAAX protease family)
MVAVIAALLFLRAAGGLDRRTLGFGFGMDAAREFAVALLAGAALLAAIESTLLLLGIHVPSPSADLAVAALARLLGAALAVGLAVAIVEELLFRGALFGGLQRTAGIATALFLTSAVYAAAHFVKFLPLPPGTEIHWYTGLELLSHAFRRFKSPIVIDAFLTLFALGLLLGCMRLARGHIAQCIGFHAGVVAGLKIAGKLTDYRRGSDFDFLVNRWDPELGWLATGFIVVMTAGYAWIFLRPRRE